MTGVHLVCVCKRERQIAKANRVEVLDRCISRFWLTQIYKFMVRRRTGGQDKGKRDERQEEGETERREGCELRGEHIGEREREREGEAGCRQTEEGWRAQLLETDHVTGSGTSKQTCTHTHSHTHTQTHKRSQCTRCPPDKLMQRHRSPRKRSKTDAALISHPVLYTHTPNAHLSFLQMHHWHCLTSEITSTHTHKRICLTKFLKKHSNHIRQKVKLVIQYQNLKDSTGSYQKHWLLCGSAVTCDSCIEKNWSERHCGTHMRTYKGTVIIEVTQVRGVKVQWGTGLKRQAM